MEAHGMKPPEWRLGWVLCAIVIGGCAFESHVETSSTATSGLAMDVAESELNVPIAAGSIDPVEPAQAEGAHGRSNADDEPFEDPFGNDPLPEPHDPWESLNTRTFAFNRGVDRHLLKPFAKGYDWAMPDFLEKALANAFHNIGILPRLLNSLLQTKYEVAGVEGGRFLINSTLGLAGLVDMAEIGFSIERPDPEDTGQTLAVYGVEQGPYLVLPFFPPLTTRDAAGYIGDAALDPATYLLPFFALFGIGAGDVVNDRALNLEFFQGVEDSTVDLYAAVRNAYLEKRAQAIKK